jgi:hypothetical protein
VAPQLRTAGTAADNLGSVADDPETRKLITALAMAGVTVTPGYVQQWDSNPNVPTMIYYSRINNGTPKVGGDCKVVTARDGGGGGVARVCCVMAHVASLLLHARHVRARLSYVCAFGV